MIFIITLSTFICITLFVMGIYWLMFKPASAATERLKQMGQPGGGMASATATIGMSPSTDESPMAALAERMAAPINRLVPPSAAEARKLQKQLMHAGYRSPNAPAIFRAIQIGVLFGYPALTFFVGVVFARPFEQMLIPMLLAFVKGFFAPRLILNRMIRKRQQRVRWGLADALDLMVVSIEAGLGLNAALVRVGEEMREVHPDISEEFELTNLEIRVGRERDEALRNLAERTGVEDLRSLVAMLIQADRFGTSIARAVRVYADSLRTKRRQRAEQAAQKAAVKLLIPLALFLFPTLFIVILGPAGLNLADTLENM
ncbi:MAG TPA: type II secretion system F family protein [Pyrinomonadaceae bacterium]|jgi:tight adherence protein C|nr:type II secretion system F family protein [Pyrinomonadaceae bacterium]